MDLALYDSELGYYARAAQRSGRAGDFFTSVDVGPLFGELLEVQLAEMAGILDSEFQTHSCSISWRPARGTVVSRRTSCARRGAAIRRSTSRFSCISSRRAPRRARAQRATLGDIGRSARVVGAARCPRRSRASCSRTSCSTRCRCTRWSCVRRSARGVRRFARHPASEPAVVICVEGPPSTPALADYLDRLGVTLEPGWRAEINLRAVDWIRDAARRLRRGLHHPDRLRSRRARAVFAGAQGRHADDVRAASEQRPRVTVRRAGVAAKPRRAGPHRARRFHQRPRGRRGRRPDDHRLPRSDLLPAGASS